MTKPVVVTIATEAGWSLVGVMASAQVDATGAVSMIAARGLDASIRPFAAAPSANPAPARLSWLGPVRTSVQRHAAHALAKGRALTTATPSKPPIRRQKKGGQR